MPADPNQYEACCWMAEQGASFTVVEFYNGSLALQGWTVAEIATLHAKIAAASGPDLGTPNDGRLVSDNFQDQQFIQFNLQVRNINATPTGWIAKVENVLYDNIPSLQSGNYTIVTIDYNDGTFTHVFTSTQDLAGFQNIVIAGGIVNPFGDGTGLTLCLP